MHLRRVPDNDVKEACRETLFLNDRFSKAISGVSSARPELDGSSLPHEYR